MSVSQQEYNAFKAILESTAASVAADIARLKDVADKASADAVAANGIIIELQKKLQPNILTSGAMVSRHTIRSCSVGG